MINMGCIAWLMSPTWAEEEKPVVIPAGTTLVRFLELVLEAKGTVYLPVERMPR
jgi:hypothetical protein